MNLRKGTWRKLECTDCGEAKDYLLSWQVYCHKADQAVNIEAAVQLY